VIVKTRTLQTQLFHNMPKPVPDLRTTVAPLKVAKVSNLTSLREGAEKHWNLRRLQTLFPSLEELFKFDSVRTPYQFGLKPANPIQTIASPDTVYVGGVEVPVHRKTTLVLPAYRIMRGDFGTSGLPCTKDAAEEEHARIHSPNNAAYVGALANSILSESGCPHFPEVYGTFTGLASRHVVNISDDYDDLSERPWFPNNIGHFFDLRLRSIPSTPTQPQIQLGEQIELDADDLDMSSPAVPAVPAAPPPPPLEEEAFTDLTGDESGDEDADIESLSTGYVFAVRSCSTDGDENAYEDGVGFEDDDEEAFAEAVFHDVPVQTTVMQKCEGTLYKLFKENPESEKRIAWLAQVVFALAFAQRNYGLVHNDLHVNNVMYVSTPREYMYYNVAGRQYRVPTFGYLMKIIDFDRATYSVKLAGMRDARFFISDQFDVNDEAGGQYNIGPFYNPKYPEMKPNPSFDLVRLATSIFWDCYPQGPTHDEYRKDPLFGILLSWLTLPDGSSVLFRNLAEGDAHDRYHGFHLYKAIARFCKGTAVPRTQIERLGSPYLWTEKLPAGEQCTVIEG